LRDGFHLVLDADGALRGVPSAKYLVGEASPLCSGRTPRRNIPKSALPKTHPNTIKRTAMGFIINAPEEGNRFQNPKERSVRDTKAAGEELLGFFRFLSAFLASFAY
jgi:hypothetical protein